MPTDTVTITIEHKLANGASYTCRHAWDELPNEHANLMVISAQRALVDTAQKWAESKAARDAHAGR